MWSGHHLGYERTMVESLYVMEEMCFFEVTLRKCIPPAVHNILPELLCTDSNAWLCFAWASPNSGQLAGACPELAGLRTDSGSFIPVSRSRPCGEYQLLGIGSSHQQCEGGTCAAVFWSKKDAGEQHVKALQLGQFGTTIMLEVYLKECSAA